jgi:twinfilin-like protein
MIVLLIPDLNEEKIHLADAGNVSTDKLSQKIPLDCARYHLYNFKHTHEGDYLETVGMFRHLMCTFV